MSDASRRSASKYLDILQEAGGYSMVEILVCQGLEERVILGALLADARAVKCST
jgi:hypothetical protein